MKKLNQVITLPLKTQPWQEDLLDKRFRLFCSCYNEILKELELKYNTMLDDRWYNDSLEIIRGAYKKHGGLPKKKDPLLEYAFEIRGSILNQYGFNEYGIMELCRDMTEVYRKCMPTNVVSISIAKPIWAAYKAVLYKGGRTVHYKKPDDFKSIASDGKSGLRIVNDKGKTLLSRKDDADIFLTLKSRGKKHALIPILIDDRDLYAVQVLKNDFKIVRIIRKMVRTRYKYYLQITLSGIPYIKTDPVMDKCMHPVGSGRVGVFIDDKLVCAVSDSAVKTWRLDEPDKDFDDKVSKTMQYLEKSRRLSNPDNYNADGTVKSRESGLEWSFSRSYKKSRCRLRDLYRVRFENLHLKREKISNEIISMGSDIVVNIPLNTSIGKNNMISDAGPGLLIKLLDYKLKFRGFDGVIKTDIGQIDKKMPDYGIYYSRLLYFKDKETK